MKVIPAAALFVFVPVLQCNFASAQTNEHLRTTGMCAHAICLAQSSDGTSTTCQFTSGPRTGQVQHWSRNTPRLTPAQIGSPCTDGQGSYGAAIADKRAASKLVKTTGDGEGDGNDDDRTGEGQSDGTSTTCRFTMGPRAGQVQHWPRNTPGLRPAPIGAPCTDGADSQGVAIPDGQQ